ncbi:MAG: cysteine desulfurase NifS [Acidobacteria bacterium]|nr:cysteine desulfurase NifS [Acidobacteriota bacterium]
MGRPMKLYFDHNATTPVAPEVLEPMLPFLREEYGNASSIHRFGQRARAAVEQARAQVASLIGCEAAEIIFTSGGTESDNLAIQGAVRASALPRKHVITSAIEHPAVLTTCHALERKSEGVSVTYLPVDSQGRVDPEQVRRELRPETVLVTIMHANNEIGTVEPLAEIASIARQAGVLLHTDAVQSTGKIPVDVKRLGVDLLSLSAHKFYGPKGIGALFIRKGLTLSPLFFGGHNIGEPRPGTENVASIVGLGVAAQLAASNLETEARRLSALRDRLEKGILERVSEAGINGPATGMQGGKFLRVPNTSNLYFDYIEGESLVIALDLQGIACSTGAACSSGAIEPSHVLTAIGVPAVLARGSLRLSLGRQNTAEDVDHLLETIPAVVKRLRALSPRVPSEKTAPDEKPVPAHKG